MAASGEGLRAIAPTEKPKDAEKQPSVELAYRNIGEADVKVYPVDLMRLYFTRRNLDAIAGIDQRLIDQRQRMHACAGDGNTLNVDTFSGSV